MKISILQQDIVWANGEANRKAANDTIDANPDSDVYVLPEMFSTGFATNPEGIAETDTATLCWMKHKAAQTGAAICGSVATEECGRFYNRFYFVEPDGHTTVYDKHHLFTYGGENKTFTPGSARPIVSYRGIRILPAVCYDLRFPIWVRNGAYGSKDNYDIIIYVASWPGVRQQAWDTLLRARAIENQCYVVGVNRVGRDPGNIYAGGSAIIDPWGNTIAESERGQVSAASADISMEKLEAFRKAFPVLNDADNFHIDNFTTLM